MPTHRSKGVLDLTPRSPRPPWKSLFRHAYRAESRKRARLRRSSEGTPGSTLSRSAAMAIDETVKRATGDEETPASGD